MHSPSACRNHVSAVPEHVLELIFAQLRVSDCAACSCVNKDLKSLAKAVLSQRLSICQDDLPMLTSLQEIHQQANAAEIPLPDSTHPSSIIKTLSYLPQALQYIAHNCEHLQQLSLRLSQSASSNKGGAWDHPLLLKRPQFKLSQFCSQCTTLQSLSLVNIPSRLIGIDDSAFQALATNCTGLQHLCIGFEGADESVYQPEDYYCSAITDAALVQIAQNCHQLRSLELLRCNQLTGQSISQVARSCTGLTTFKLHNCPKVSERAIVQVFERCHELEVVDIVPARWSPAQDLLLWQTDGWGRWQLGFHALFTIAANCPNLKELIISEEHLEEAVVDSLGICTVVEGCRQLTKVAFTQLDMADSVFERIARQSTQLQVLQMHDSGLTDLALSAVVKGCQQLAYLSIQGPPLRPSRPGVTPHPPLAPHGTITDAGLKAIAAHCTRLKGLSITRNACVSDKGIANLADAPQAVLQQLQELALDAVQCTREGLQTLLQRCTGLRKLELYGLQARQRAQM